MISEIAREELKQKLDHPKRSVVVETLEPERYEFAHIPGAINIPPDRIKTLAPEVIPQKDTEVIVYCAGPTCHASQNAEQELAEMGYSNIRHYAGGKQDWVEAGLPVARGRTERAA